LKEAAGGNIPENSDAFDEAAVSVSGMPVSGVMARAAAIQVSVPPISGVVLEQPPLVSIRAPALPSLLEPTYAYLAAYCDACFPMRVTQRLNVAIYELCANALQHSAGGEVWLQLLSHTGSVSFVVENYAELQQRERLRSQLERVCNDPAAAFAREMASFERGSLPPPMLGLVRVAHDCGLELSLTVEGDRVRVSTSCAI
jgi:hypothetical protein